MTYVRNSGKDPIEPCGAPQQAELVQAAAVQNTWYTILDTIYDVSVEFVSIKVNNFAETLECRVTINGEALTPAGMAAADGDTNYFYYAINAYVSGDTGLNAFHVRRGQNCRSLKVEMRKTTAAGASTLTGRVTYIPKS